MKNLFYCIVVIFAATQAGCKKWVAVEGPVTSTNSDIVYKTDATAIAVLTGIYSRLSTGNFLTGKNSISVYCGLSADELNLFPSVTDVMLKSYHTNSLSVEKGGYELWNPGFSFIFKCNAAIEGLSDATTLTPQVKQQLLGEAKFMRAFFFFYMTNLFGDIPIPLTTDHKVNSELKRSPQSLVFEQIKADLIDAQNLLSEEYLDGTLLMPYSDRVRPTKWVADALLARVHLYMGDWTSAETISSSLISSSRFELSDLSSAFMRTANGNRESIWELQPVNAGWNTEDAKVFVINATPGFEKPVYLSQLLLNSFEVNDGRKTSWIRDTTIDNVAYAFPYKYRSATIGDPVTEYFVVFRLSEQYLIRAEARAQLGDVAGSQSDLNFLRGRAGLGTTTANDKDGLIEAIIQERQVELFTELGQRWFDLKRTNRVDAVMSVVAPQKANSSWASYQQLYPLPLEEIQKAPNLNQNLGY